MNLRQFIALFDFFYSQRFKDFHVPDFPHFDAEGALAFENLMKSATSYLEFGSGGSTVLAARLGLKTLSIESDKYYARQVQAKCGAANSIEIIEINIGLTKQWGYPLFTLPTPSRLRRWRIYIEAPFTKIREIGAPFPDLILIDGRFRIACALESARQAQAHHQSATLFFDDYADRKFYHVVEDYLGMPKMAGRAAIFSIGTVAIPSELVSKFISDAR